MAPINPLDAKVALASLFVLAASLIPCHAQQPPERRVIPLIAYDAKGRFVTGLNPESLPVKDRQVRVLSVRPDNSGRRILLLVDWTGIEEALENELRREQAQLIVKEIVASLQKKRRSGTARLCPGI